MSVINLAHDLGKIALLGKLQAWMEAYSLLVHSVSTFLFGWIRIAWMNISSDEHHVLVVAMVFATTIFRAEYSYHVERIQRGEEGVTSTPFSESLGKGIAYFAMAFVPVLVIPEPCGVYAGIAGLSWQVLMSQFHKETNLAPAASVRKELLGVLAVFLVLIAINQLVIS